MNQAGGSSSAEWVEYANFDDEEPDPCPEKYRDPLWEEFFKDEEPAIRSAKGKEKINPVNHGYHQPCNWPGEGAGRPYNVRFDIRKIMKLLIPFYKVSKYDRAGFC